MVLWVDMVNLVMYCITLFLYNSVLLVSESTMEDDNVLEVIALLVVVAIIWVPKETLLHCEQAGALTLLGQCEAARLESNRAEGVIAVLIKDLSQALISPPAPLGGNHGGDGLPQGKLHGWYFRVCL